MGVGNPIAPGVRIVGVLDKVSLPEATLIRAITKGGSSVMTKAAIAKYTTTMVPYGTTPKAVQINEIAAFIYLVTHK